MFEPSTVFNDGSADVNVVFGPCDNEDSAKEIANRYHHLLLDIANGDIFMLDQHKKVLKISNETIICRVCTKELGQPIDCSTEEGKQKALDALISRDPTYSVTEEDMRQITLEEMIDLVRPRANLYGLVAFDSIAYGVREQ